MMRDRRGGACLACVPSADVSGGVDLNREGYMPKQDEPRAVPVETFAHGLSDKQLACRELGHVWVQWAVEVVREGRRTGGYVRTFKCRQCRSERHQVIDSTGHALKNGYRYADGYLAANVQKGFSRDTFRLESVTRWIESHQEQKAG